VVDWLGSVDVVDEGNERMVRWSPSAREGEVIVGRNGQGSQGNQLHWPSGISFDQDKNLYVVDRNNHLFNVSTFIELVDQLTWEIRSRRAEKHFSIDEQRLIEP
jgi:sugar lactone lactonase YvrE